MVAHREAGAGQGGSAQLRPKAPAFIGRPAPGCGWCRRPREPQSPPPPPQPPQPPPPRLPACTRPCAVGTWRNGRCSFYDFFSTSKSLTFPSNYQCVCKDKATPLAWAAPAACAAPAVDPISGAYERKLCRIKKAASGDADFQLVSSAASAGTLACRLHREQRCSWLARRRWTARQSLAAGLPVKPPPVFAEKQCVCVCVCAREVHHRWGWGIQTRRLQAVLPSMGHHTATVAATPPLQGTFFNNTCYVSAVSFGPGGASVTIVKRGTPLAVTLKLELLCKPTPQSPGCEGWLSVAAWEYRPPCTSVCTNLAAWCQGGRDAPVRQAAALLVVTQPSRHGSLSPALLMSSMPETARPDESGRAVRDGTRSF